MMMTSKHIMKSTCVLSSLAACASPAALPRSHRSRQRAPSPGDAIVRRHEMEVRTAGQGWPPRRLAFTVCLLVIIASPPTPFWPRAYKDDAAAVQRGFAAAATAAADKAQRNDVVVMDTSSAAPSPPHLMAAGALLMDAVATTAPALDAYNQSTTTVAPPPPSTTLLSDDSDEAYKIPLAWAVVGTMTAAALGAIACCCRIGPGGGHADGGGHERPSEEQSLRGDIVAAATFVGVADGGRGERRCESAVGEHRHSRFSSSVRRTARDVEAAAAGAQSTLRGSDVQHEELADRLISHSHHDPDGAERGLEDK